MSEIICITRPVAAPRFRVRTSQDKAAELAPAEFGVAEAFGHHCGMGGDRDPGPVYHRPHFVEAYVSRDLIVLGDSGNECMQGLPSLGSVGLERSYFSTNT